MRRMGSLSSLIAVVAVLQGCGSGISDTDGMGSHACSKGQNGNWGSVPGLTLEHYEPRTCPVSDSTSVNGGGTIIESGVTFPNSGVVSTGYLKVFNVYYVSTFSGSGILDSDSESFAFVGDEWRSQLFVSWSPGPNPDWMEFAVDCFASCSTPRSYVEVSYPSPE